MNISEAEELSSLIGQAKNLDGVLQACNGDPGSILFLQLVVNEYGAGLSAGAMSRIRTIVAKDIAAQRRDLTERLERLGVT